MSPDNVGLGASNLAMHLPVTPPTQFGVANRPRTPEPQEDIGLTVVSDWINPAAANLSWPKWHRTLDGIAFRCDFSHAWRKTIPRQRRATGSLTFCILPPCKLSPGDWRLAERWFFPASPRPLNPFSPRCWESFFRNGRSSSSRKI